MASTEMPDGEASVPAASGAPVPTFETREPQTITIPVVLPKETNIARQTKPENIDISVNKDGDIFWNQQLVADSDALFKRLSKIATMTPQPEVHIRGDGQARYESIGRVVFQCQRASIQKVSFVTEPPPKG